MSKKKKITLVEAQGLYAKNEDIREFLESKFSKEELTASTTPQEETLEQKFKRVWEEKILTQCDSVWFLDATGRKISTAPTTHLVVFDKEGSWLFKYNYSSESKSFTYSNPRVHELLEKEVSWGFGVVNRLVKSWVGGALGLQGFKPGAFGWVADSGYLMEPYFGSIEKVTGYLDLGR